MTQEDQLRALGQELDNLVERFRNEFDIPIVSVMGILQAKSMLLFELLRDQRDEEDE